MKFQSGEPEVPGLYLTQSSNNSGDYFYNVWDGVWYRCGIYSALAEFAYKQKAESYVQDVEWCFIRKL